MNFTVEEIACEVDLEDTATAPKRKPGRPANKKEPIEDQDDSKAAEALAQALQEAIDTGLKNGMNAALELGETKVKSLLELAETKIAKLSKEYAKPRDLMLTIKVGALDPKKLKNRACSILPSLVAQAKIGQAGGNWPLIIGPTGCGKTVAAEQVADALSLNFSHLCFSQGASETWLWGRQTPIGFVLGDFWRSYKEGGVFLADEIDAADANLLMSLNTSIANGHAYNPIVGESVEKHKDFIFIGAANTNGKGGTGAYTGRSRLDAATLNRFSIFTMEYDKDVESELCENTTLLHELHKLRMYLADQKSMDIISTRDIKNAYMQFKTGFKEKDIFASLASRMDGQNKEYILREYCK